MTEAAILPGAEPWSASGGAGAGAPGALGALVLHGFTGCPQSMRGLAEAFAAAGCTVELPRLPGHGGDVADPAQHEVAYSEAPVAAMLSLFDALDALDPALPHMQMPALVITSRQDHVVPTASSEHFVAMFGGPTEHVWLERSYH